MRDTDERGILTDGKSSLREKEFFPMRQSGERVHGPYPHYSRWRLILDRGGKREKLSFATEGEANRRKEEILKELQGRTVSDAVQAHTLHMRERGLRAGTIDRAEAHLRRFFQLDEKRDGKNVRFARTGGFLDDLKPTKCSQLYGGLAKAPDISVDTHRNALVAVKMFGA